MSHVGFNCIFGKNSWLSIDSDTELQMNACMSVRVCLYAHSAPCCSLRVPQSNDNPNSNMHTHQTSAQILASEYHCPQKGIRASMKNGILGMRQKTANRAWNILSREEGSAQRIMGTHQKDMKSS